MVRDIVGSTCTDNLGYPSTCMGGTCIQSRTTICRSTNNFQFSDAVGVDSSTFCNLVQCRSGGSSFAWSLSAPDGTPCGGASNPKSAFCINATCVPANSLTYQWRTTAWPATCLDGIKYRGVNCYLVFGGSAFAVPDVSCVGVGPKPADSQSCEGTFFLFFVKHSFQQQFPQLVLLVPLVLLALQEPLVLRAPLGQQAPLVPRELLVLRVPQEPLGQQVPLV
jgi:hypothetical protein